jgi:SAM-dependent methyltransferase
MFGWLTPARRRGVELLDLPETSDEVREKAMADLARSNALFGGTRSVLAAIRPLFTGTPREILVCDVGTGTADIPSIIRHDATKRGIQSMMLGIDTSESLLHLARSRLDGAVAADARSLPLRRGTVDIVICSQLLHHFVEADARLLIAELHRVSRGAVVIADIRRSWIAAAGFWIASMALGFHGVTRRDGVTSVLRGFTAHELAAMVRDVTGSTPVVRRGAFWRVSVTWKCAPR